ncbi:MAG: hypothetical protein VW395_09065 [Methylotenera sp.]
MADGTDGNVAFILRFKRPIPLEGTDPFGEPDVRYDASRCLWTYGDGTPVYLGGRASKPYTSTMTASRLVKGGYTPSGKYKPAKVMPARMDKRAGK